MTVHVAGRAEPVTVDMVDVGAKGVRFRRSRSAGPGQPVPANAPAEAQTPSDGAAGSDAGAGSDTSAGSDTGAGSDTSDGRASPRRIALDQQVAFGFVVPGQRVCVATGRVTRIVGHAARPEKIPEAILEPILEEVPPEIPEEFVLSIERANDAFHGFLGSLAR